MEPLITSTSTVRPVVPMSGAIVQDNNETRRSALGCMLVHDMRSPLNALLVSLVLIHKHLPPQLEAPAVGEALDIAMHASKKLIGMVDAFLDMAQMENDPCLPKRSQVNFRQLAEEAIAELKPLAGEDGIVLVNEVPPDLPTVFVDPEKVSRVLTNLLDNALKFTAGKDTVRVGGDLMWAVDGTPWLRCAVLDSGPGIPETDRERIFDQFFQVQGQMGWRTGSGLGLAFCKLAVEAHGGQIWAKNRPGGGSVFYFTLPIG